MSTEEEPAAKKAKTNGDEAAALPTGWEDYTLNCSEALMKADEGRHLSDIASESVSVLQGVGPMSQRVLEVLKIKTVQDLATYKYFLMARALKTLSETETAGERPKGSVMNVDKAVDKEFESKTLKEIVEAPISALEGLSDDAGQLLKDLGVTTVGDLAEFKYCKWAEAFVSLSKYENTRTAAQRKQDAELKKLS